MGLGLCRTDIEFLACSGFGKKEKKRLVVDWQGWIAELIGHMCGFMGVKKGRIKIMYKKKSDNSATSHAEPESVRKILAVVCV